MIPKILNAADIIALFPKTIDDIEKLTQKAITNAQINLEEILNLNNDNRNFYNSIYKLDLAATEFYSISDLFYAVQAVYPEEAMRNAAHHNALKLNAFGIDNFSQNKDLYNIVKKYSIEKAAKENLTNEQKYYLSEALKSYERSGLNLDNQKQERLKNLKKRIR